MPGSLHRTLDAHDDDNDPAWEQGRNRIGEHSYLVPTLKFAADAAMFADNVQVQFAEGTGGLPTLNEFTKEMTQEYSQAHATVLDSKAVKVSGKTAFRLDITLPVQRPDGTTVVGRAAQLYVVSGDGGAIVTVATPNDDAGVALIDDVLASVHRM